MTSEVTLSPTAVSLGSIISVVKHEFPNGGNKLEVKSVVRVANTTGSKKTKPQDGRNQSKVSKVSYSTEKPILLLPFGHQVSGRASILCYDESTLLKPYVARELFFYQTIHKDLRKYTPQFRGLITVSFIEDSRTSSMLAYALPHTLVKPDAKSIIKLSAEVPKPHSKRCVKDFGKTHVIFPSDSHQLDSDGQDSFSLDENESLFVGSGDFCSSVSQFANNSGADEDDVVSELSQGFEMNVSINDKRPLTHGDSEPLHASTGLHNPWNSKVLDDAWLKLRINESEHHSSSRKKRFALLENVVARYRRPCVLDLKIGTRVRENASPEKIARHVTAINLGARLSGMQIYDRQKEQFIYHNKYYGHNLTVSGFKSNLRHFFSRGTNPITKSASREKSECDDTILESPSVDKKLVQKAMEKLSELRKIVGSIQSHRFYSSSVLLLYEGDVSKDESEASEKVASEEDMAEEFAMEVTKSGGHSPERKSNSRSFSFSEFLQRLKSTQHKHRLKHRNDDSPSVHDLQGHGHSSMKRATHDRHSHRLHERDLRQHEKQEFHKHNEGLHDGYKNRAEDNQPLKLYEPDRLHGDVTKDCNTHKSHEHLFKNKGDSKSRTKSHTGHDSRDHADKIIADSKSRANSHKTHDSCEHADKLHGDSSSGNGRNSRQDRGHQDKRREKSESSNGERRSHRTHLTNEQSGDACEKLQKLHSDFMGEDGARFTNKSWPRSHKDRKSSREADRPSQKHHHEVDKQPIQREDLKRRHNEVSRGNNGDVIDVRMIDFAHYCFHDNEMHPGPDGGFLFGLDNLINLLNDMMNS